MKTLFYFLFVLFLNSTGSYATTYTWNATGGGNWTTSTNWTPTRTTPATNDILVFSDGNTYTINAISIQTIGQLFISGNTNVTFNNSNTTLTIGGGTGTDFSIASGSSLTFAEGNAFTLTLATGTTGSISGSITLLGAAHRITVTDASGLTVNSGGTVTAGTGFTGNVFGSTGTANVVNFNSGSTYVHFAGSNPFGLNAPNSKVVFNHGSKFSMRANLAPSFSGRTYADFEVNSSTFNQDGTGGSALVMDSLIIVDGTLNLNMTGGVTINGNINVASGEQLTFQPTSANTYTMAGTASNINNKGTFIVGTNATLSFGASSVYSLINGNITQMLGTITNNGSLDCGSVVVSGTGAFTLSGTGTLKSGHSSGVTGNITVSGTKTFSSGHKIEWNGSGAQSMGLSGLTLTTPNNYTIRNTGGTVTADANVTFGNSAALTCNASTNFDANTRTFTFGTSGTATFNGTVQTSNTNGLNGGAATTIVSTNTPTVTLGGSSTVTYTSGSTQTITGRTDYNNLTTSGAGAKNMGGNITLAGTLTLGGGTLSLGTNTLTISGNAPARTTGNIDASNSGATVAFTNGSSLTVPASTFTGNIGNLTMNASGGVTFSDPVTVTGALAMQNGILNMGANTLTIGTSTSNLGSVSHSGGAVRGTIKRWFAASTTTNSLFPLDNGSSSYVEAKISFTVAPSAGGTLTASYTSSGAGSLPGGFISAGALWPGVNFINLSPQFWTISAGDGLTGGTYSIDLTANSMNLSTTNWLYTGIVKRATGGGNTWVWNVSNHSSTTNASATPTLHGIGFTSFSDFAVAGNTDNLLPVELSSFTASVEKQNVLLNWSTVQEVNNRGFDIERKSSDNVWKKAGYVQGSGTTTQIQNYSFSDRGLSAGHYNYRLKQIDYNGNYEYHELSGEVIIGIPSKYILAQNYPNPFNPVTRINFELPVTNYTSLKVYDMQGREVAQLVNEVKDAGYYSVQFDANNLSSGTYFYKIQIGDFVSTKKMVLMK